MPLVTRSLMTVLAFMFCLAGPGCDRGSDSVPSESKDAGSNRIAVLTTTGMVGDVVARVAGDRADVTVLMGAGIDPHLFKPTRSDSKRMLDADIIFMNGHLLEGKLSEAILQAERAGKPVYRVAELIDSNILLNVDEFEDVYDPHVWMDPRAWTETVRIVRDALTEHDRDGATAYQSNATSFMEELAALDTYAEQVLSTVPEESRVLVTAHDAFGYFGARYGFTVIGIQGISTESEAGLNAIEALVDLLVDRSIKSVFVESTVSDRNINAVISGAANRGHRVVIGGSLYSDAMGDEGTYEGTYIGMIDHNVTTISRSLGGSAPTGGMHGSLSN